MKKWTVMFIPKDRSGTFSLALSNLHLFLLTGLVLCVAFITSFLYASHQAISLQLSQLREENRLLELENARRPLQTPKRQANEEQARDVEAKLRSEYEASLSAITAKLSELYAIETKARDITGLAPRLKKSAPAKSEASGKGGPMVNASFSVASVRVQDRVRPAQVIYGMANPSADLILQEILLRTQSFRDLVNDMEVSIERIERMPGIWPLVRGAGRISSTFGYRRDPINFRIGRHTGTDICAPVGTRVRATAKGVVTSAGWDGDYGNMVKVRHSNGMETWYAHLSRILAKPGQSVRRDDVIGQVGTTGRTTGPHLHYEVHVNGQPVDPEKYLTD